jgi:hypothetical protein
MRGEGVGVVSALDGCMTIRLGVVFVLGMDLCGWFKEGTSFFFEKKRFAFVFLVEV